MSFEEYCTEAMVTKMNLCWFVFLLELSEGNLVSKFQKRNRKNFTEKDTVFLSTC